MNATVCCMLIACATILVSSCTAGPGTGRSIWDAAPAVAGTWSYVGARNLGASGVQWPAIAFDTANTPYVAYLDWSAGADATVHRFDGTQWVTVGAPSHANVSGANISGPPCIVIGPDGNPILAYKNTANWAEVKRFDGTQWVPLGASAVISAGAVDNVALAISGSTVFCAYQDSTQGNMLTVRAFDNGSGTWTDLGGGPATTMPIWVVSMSVDSNGHPWVAFNDTTGGGNYPSVVRWNGSSWDYDQWVMGTTTSDTYALGVDPAGVGWFVGKKNSLGKASAMKRVGGTWVTEGTPGFSSGDLQWASLAFGSGGVPWFAYEDAALSNAVTVKVFTGTDWVPAGTPGFSPNLTGGMSIAVDGLGHPVVVFEDPDYSGGASVMALQ